jgi:tetratricopeptide (TPR) repeat protein
MRIIITALLLYLSGCVNQQTAEQGVPLTNTEVILERGFSKLSARKTKDAIKDFDEVIVLCEGQYSATDPKAYASRDLNETIYYLAKAATDDQSAIAVDTTCSDALYLRGYASLDFGQIELAEGYIQRAIDMAPVNSMYLSEMGHIYQTRREWDAAIAMFIRAEAAATYSPDDVKERELARAKRGIGYSLIELGQLDEAEAKFKECLEIDPDDQAALAELQYIEHLRVNGPEGADMSAVLPE